MEWQIDLAEDMRDLLEAMRHADAPSETDATLSFSVDENGLYVGDESEDDWDDDFEEDGLLAGE